MQTIHEQIPGDVPGTAYDLTIHRLASDAGGAPVYIQAALHAGERPGTALLHYRLPMLEKAETDGLIRAPITVVPQCNPVGMAQHLFHEHMGRFDLANRVNFNRNFPVRGPDAQRHLLPTDAPAPAADRIKSRLLALSAEARIILDLHCDDESVQYIYAPAALWPAMRDLADAIGARAAILWSNDTDNPFEAAAFAELQAASEGDLEGAVVTTVELRGMRDVTPELAQQDAGGVYRFLCARGVINDAVSASKPEMTCPGVPIAHIEMIDTAIGGTVLYHVTPGDSVAAGDILAEVIAEPGNAAAAYRAVAPQDGFILTRRSTRFVRAGENLVKLVGKAPSASARDGTLEAR